ncbi:MAG: hypothetical protein ACKPIB_28090, partial [Dolichospermum sp.]
KTKENTKMANIQIFEINEDGELLVNDPALAGALQELTTEELKMINGGKGQSNVNCGILCINNCSTPPETIKPPVG